MNDEKLLEQMKRNILKFGEKDAKDIMTHRKNIMAINSEQTLEDVIKFALEENYSRFPVYEEDIDNIVGTIHLRDMLGSYVDEKNRMHPIREITGCIRPVSFVPETKSIDTLFKDMQEKKNHIVIVLDEYGMTAGLVALEDILEEIVGNIQDEYDEEEETIVRQPDGSYIVPGLTDLDDIEELLQFTFEEEDFDTLNGFLVDKFEHIPAEDEECFLEYKGYGFLVLSVSDNIIQTVKIEKSVEK